MVHRGDVLSLDDPIPFLCGRMTSALSRSPRLSQRVEQARWEYALSEPARKMVDAGGLTGDSAEAVIRWLVSDRELAGQVLSWCNTPLFNLTRPYKDLNEAVALMATADLGRLTFLADLRRRLLAVPFYGGVSPAGTSDGGFSMQRLWRHGLAVGTVASMISRICGAGDPGTSMLAGVLHDLGIAVTATLHPSESAAIFSEVDQLTTASEIEREMLGWDHTELGEEVLRQWQMPESVCVAAGLHHSSETEMVATGDPILACVVIANFLCSRTGWGTTGAHNLATPGDGIFKLLDVGPEMLMVVWHQLHETLNQAGRMA